MIFYNTANMSHRMNTFSSIAIIGAGAVGGYYGGRLAQHGASVHFLLRSEYDVWKSQGLHVQSIDGDFSLPPERLNVYNDPAAMPQVDLAIVTLKTTENAHLKQLITPLLHDNTSILTLQNGLGNERSLADLFGAQRIVGGMAFTCINRVGPGQIHHSDHGLIRVGEFQTPGPSKRCDEIVRLFKASKIRAEVTENLLAARWDKQVWNVPFNGLGALLDATTDRLIASEEGTRLVRNVMEEVLQAAAADGVRLDPRTPEQKISNTRTMGAYLTSTQVDRRLGKSMEIEAIFGKTVAAARTAGIHAPLLDMLYFSLNAIDGRKNVVASNKIA